MRISHSLRIVVVVLLIGLFVTVAGQRRSGVNSAPRVPAPVLLQLIRVEDERRWDDTLKKFLADQNAQVRKRAVFAAGRIGNEGAVPVLAEMLLTDRDNDVRQMAAFALGEIESPGGAYALVEVLKRLGNENASVRARAVEALGKIVAAMISNEPAPADASKPPQTEDERLDIIKAAIVGALRFEDSRRSQSDRLTILLGLTAVLRAKPDGVGKLVAQFLGYSDPRIVADALNTLARLRLKEGTDKARELLVKHSDPIVRANAARLLGVAEDKGSFDALLDRALHDSDLRVRVSAIRALGSLKDKRAADPLLDRGKMLTQPAANTNRLANINEALEIATSLGLVMPNTNSEQTLDWLRTIRELDGRTFTPVEVAFARIAPQTYATSTYVLHGNPVSLANGLAELATSKTGQPLLDASNKEVATTFLAGALNCRPASTRSAATPNRIRPGMVTMVGGRCRPLDQASLPDYLRAFAAFKPPDVQEILLAKLKHEDVIVRSTAAELLGEQSASDANRRALIEALPRALGDKDLNDAALAILDALAKQKNKEANDAIKTALDSKDHLIRRRAVALLKANGVGDFLDRIGTVQTRNTEADYARAIARIGKHVTATVVTSKGSFTIEFLPEDAPLTVDNFIQLAKKRYFNGQTIPRVVPNFVVQAGDPRGDQNGGPGYQIRCEINEVPYERGAVGMALSGKDTGGSQWFVTHSPQPHLDGGYTVFGRVIRGMDVVDQIARGDRIVQVIVNEQ